MASEQFSLCWDNFHKNMSSGMNSLLENEDLVDVTLAVEGRYLKAHKMVLSVCSPYFRELFKSSPCKHPIVFMKDVSYVAMSDLLQFMYQGEVQVSQENLTTFIKTAESLQIKGLTGDGNGSAECDNEPIQPDVKSLEPELPKPQTSMARPKKTHLISPAPASKRPRLTEQAAPAIPSPALAKTEPVVAATPAAAVSSGPTTSEMIQFKMEPYDQGHSSTVAITDDTPDESFTDDPLDESNADDTNEDYSMMEGGDEEPQAGTSADGTAGEGQGFMKLLNNQAWIRFELKQMKRKVEEMEHNLISKTIQQTPEESIFVTKLPLETISDLNEIELLVASDTNKLCELVNILYLAGTDTVHKSIYGMLKKLMSNNVALLFSGQGKKNKLAFSKLVINKAVIHATRKRHKMATDDEIKKHISLYLAQTKARMNIRKMVTMPF